MHDVLDRLKHIPPWGYAVIALGVLVLAFFTKNKGASSSATTQTLAPVDPSAETAANDALNRMQDMYDQLQSKLDTTTQNESTLQAGLTDLTNQINQLKTATPPPATNIPSSGGVTPVPSQGPIPSPTHAPTPSPTHTGTTSASAPHVTLAETGTYTSMTQAEKALQWITRHVGPNAQIIQSNGQYRVMAQAPSVQGAQDIVNGLKKNHLTTVGYVTDKKGA